MSANRLFQEEITFYLKPGDKPSTEALVKCILFSGFEKIINIIDKTRSVFHKLKGHKNHLLDEWKFLTLIIHEKYNYL